MSERAVPCLDIDLLPAADGSGASEEALSEVLDAAFGPEGLGLLCLVSEAAFEASVARLRGALLPMAQRLARLPSEELEAIREEGTRNVSNWSRGIDGERSGFYFHPLLDEPSRALPPEVAPGVGYGATKWPGRMPELRATARRELPQLVDLGRRLAAAVDRRCTEVVAGYRPGTLQRLVAPAESCNHKCRLICYHDFESSEQLSKAKGMWAPPHKDTGLLTLLVPGIFLDSEGRRVSGDPEVGLYVRDRKGKVSQIKPPKPECLYVQVGEAMQIVSGGLYHATEHCVRGPSSPARGYERATLALFLQPHGHEELPLPHGVSMQQVAQQAYDGLFRMFLLYQPKEASGINFEHFCQREGF